MVIVLMGPEGPEVEQLGVALAAQLGWRCIDADAPHSSGDLHVVVARALDRREPLVLVCERLTARERGLVAGGRRPVRFVAFGTAREPGSDVMLVLNDAADVDINIGRIRSELGV